MALDVSVRALLDQMKAAALPKLWELGPQAARAAMRSRLLGGKDTPIGGIENRSVPGPAQAIPVRVYTPIGAEGPLPGFIFFHGGGFVIGDLETHDDLCRTLANGSMCRVVSVDYRLAPECPFPAAVEDCWAATQWICAHADDFGIAGPIAIGGDSAGGNLAAVVTQLARANGPDLAFQLLIYPVTQLGGPDTPSMKQNAKGYFLERDSMRWFTRLYCPDASRLGDPRLSPLLAPDLSGLPPAYVVTAGFDPLRDEGKAYADKLDAAGVPVTYVNYPGMVHGFFSMRGLVPKAREAIAAAAAAVHAGVTAE
ncbi:MAG: alpha/beta hydrolase [Alphaproteobacteria bacterium]|nr:alpha/beta hydrolase [Alphaproteobacteria bacterium]MBV9693160.1 alpha/beta hydrolase [Alphaproteobacteria bacterium]